MQKQTLNKENATSNTSDNVNETPKQDSNLIDRKKIKGTPFQMIRHTTDNGKYRYFIALGEYRLTEPTEEEKDALKKLQTEQWLITANTIAIMVRITADQITTTDKKTPYETESL